MPGTPPLKDKRKVRILETGQVFQSAQEVAFYLNMDTTSIYNIMKGLPPKGWKGIRGPVVLHFARAAPNDPTTDVYLYAFKGATTTAAAIMNRPGVRFHIQYYVFNDALYDQTSFVRLMIGLAMQHKADLQIGQEQRGLTFLWKDGNATQG